MKKYENNHIFIKNIITSKIQILSGVFLDIKVSSHQK